MSVVVEKKALPQELRAVGSHNEMMQLEDFGRRVAFAKNNNLVSIGDNEHGRSFIEGKINYQNNQAFLTKADLLNDSSYDRLINSASGYDVPQTALSILDLTKESLAQQYYSLGVLDDGKELTLEDFIPHTLRTNLVYHENFKFRKHAKIFNTDRNAGMTTLGFPVANAIQPKERFDTTEYFKIATYINSVGYNILEVGQASILAYDVIQMRQDSVNEQFALQQRDIAFGGSDQLGMKGLLNLSGSDVITDTSTIPALFSTQTSAEFGDFVTKLRVVQQNQMKKGLKTRLDTFIIPYSEYTFLSTTPTGKIDTFFNEKTRLEYLQEKCKIKVVPSFFMEKNDDFGVNPFNSYYRYMLYSNNKDVLERNIMMPFSLLQTNTGNGFDFTTMALARFSEVCLYRGAGVVYFQHA